MASPTTGTQKSSCIKASGYSAELLHHCVTSPTQKLTASNLRNRLEPGRGRDDEFLARRIGAMGRQFESGCAWMAFLKQKCTRSGRYIRRTDCIVELESLMFLIVHLDLSILGTPLTRALLFPQREPQEIS